MIEIYVEKVGFNKYDFKGYVIRKCCKNGGCDFKI
jgi:hypothetical protein